MAAPPTLKRTLAAIEAELFTAVRLKVETKERIKRLRTERDTHEDFVARCRKAARAGLERELPPYLFDVLVAHPRDPEKYGALLGYSIEHEHHSRYIKDGIYSSQLLITARFEKKTINYEQDTDNGSWAFPTIHLPNGVDKKQRPSMTQRALWTRALEMNGDDTGEAFVSLCEDAFSLIDDFEDKVVDAPLRDIEAYRRIYCKLPNVTADDMRELYGLQAFAWLSEGRSLDALDINELVCRVNAGKDLFDTSMWDEEKK
jgi:hypothetical protein